MYIELESGYGDDGPGNYVDVETGEEFWVSGVKKNGSDRRRAGSGPVRVDEDVRAEYAALIAR